MSLVMKPGLVAALVAFWTTNAAACDVGPFALEFRADSSQLSGGAKALLDYERSMLRTNGQNVIRVVFHGKHPRSDAAGNRLRQNRAKAIGDFLGSKGVLPSQMSIIETGKSPLRMWDGRSIDDSVTVELASGCGG